MGPQSIRLPSGSFVMELRQSHLPETCQCFEAVIDQLEADGAHQAAVIDQLATLVELLKRRIAAQEQKNHLLRLALEEAEQVTVTQQEVMEELAAKVDEHDRIATVHTRRLDRLARLN